MPRDGTACPPSSTPTDSPTATSSESGPPVLDEDGRFNVAGQRNLAGISGPLRTCRSDQDEHVTLELRLANRFEKITMKIGQSDESEQSDAVLNVKLVGNGKYIDSVKVPFNQIDDFSAPVADVNALKIELWIGGNDCYTGRTVGAVLSGLRLE